MGRPAPLLLLLLLLLASALPACHALDDGLALTPPMGWRSWNCYAGDVTDADVRATVDAITDRSRGGVSLLDLGFSDVGVDDGWQACKTGREVGGLSSFHDASGAPLVNKSKFPDVKAMVAYGHSKNVTMGWYDNNCICMDGPAKAGDPSWAEKCFAGDAQFLIENDFDAVKIDNCAGGGAAFTARFDAIQASGKKLLIENSNQGFGNPRQQ